MATYTNTATVTVPAGQNLTFTTASSCCKNRNVEHRNGSGIFSLRGSNSWCNPAQYRVKFNGNVAVATGGTVGTISVAIAQDGEAIYSATASSTPAAIGEFNNVSCETIVTVPCGCCQNVSIENVSDPATAIDIANSRIEIKRVC